MVVKAIKQGISARIDPANHRWLKAEAARLDRSANWVLDKLLTEAREAAETNKSSSHEKH